MKEMVQGSKCHGVIWLVLVFLPLLSACGMNRGVERGELQGQTVSAYAPVVAVLPFENLSEHPNAGEILTRLMATELYKQRLFNVREESEWLRSSVADDGEKAGERLPSSMPRIQQLAHKVGADGALLGSVTEFHYQHGLREEPVVGLSVRMVRSCDGKVVWASSRSASGKGLFRRESLNQVAQRVVQELVSELKQVGASVLYCAKESAGHLGETVNPSAPAGDESSGKEGDGA